MDQDSISVNGGCRTADCDINYTSECVKSCLNEMIMSKLLVCCCVFVVFEAFPCD